MTVEDIIMTRSSAPAESPLKRAQQIAAHRTAKADASLLVSARESREGGKLLREVDFTLVRPDHAAESRTIVWEIETSLDIPHFETLDFAALATFFVAMKNNARLFVRGPVTATMMRNLEELNEAWFQLCPDKYSIIPIEATEIVPDRPQPLPGAQRAVLAFSGGIDASFTLVRHLSGHAGLRTARVATAVMVHGFDIPLSAEKAFATARRAAERALQSVGVPLTVVRTNWRNVAETEWEMDHMAALSACLHQFAGACDVGILGSDMTYAFQFHPWGSNPAVDPLLGGGRFGLRIEGQGIWRTARAALVATVPSVAENVRVCWAGPLTGANCGRCEKCVRTQLNFLAAGYDPGPAFPVRASLRDILLLNAHHAGSLSYLTDILRTARANGITGPWRTAATINWHINSMLLPFRRFMPQSSLLFRVLRFTLGKRVKRDAGLESAVPAPPI